MGASTFAGRKRDVVATGLNILRHANATVALIICREYINCAPAARNVKSHADTLLIKGWVWRI